MFTLSESIYRTQYFFRELILEMGSVTPSSEKTGNATPSYANKYGYLTMTTKLFLIIMKLALHVCSP